MATTTPDPLALAHARVTALSEQLDYTPRDCWPLALDDDEIRHLLESGLYALEVNASGALARPRPEHVLRGRGHPYYHLGTDGAWHRQ